ncbi:hypothetical protein [Nocardia thailandica]|uniref:hypothetical protein n=1 Tax=Nocardia thailandica TaxID=257275 RepID=UPI0002EBCD1D|nr:hypothetical protein [Nocardia thailandica]
MSDRDTLAAVILGSGLNLDRGPYVETWPEDEREYHRRPDWPSFEHRAHAMQEYRRGKLAASILAAGVRPPAREITTAAEADTLPVGTILFHVDCPNPDPCIWRRACSPSEVEDEIDGGTHDHIHWAAWGDEDERYDGADLEGHADCGGPLLAVYIPTEEDGRG